MREIITLKSLEHFKMFFFVTGEEEVVTFKGEDRMGDFGQAMYKTGKQYMHAYSRADERNMRAMNLALCTPIGLHKLLSLAWTELPSVQGHCVAAFVLLGYPPRMLYQMLTGEDI